MTVWQLTGGMTTARQAFGICTLDNGKILVAGGHAEPSTTLALCEIYDPVAKTWSATGSLNTARELTYIVRLDSGLFMAVGGGYSTACELYDPAAGTWSNTGSFSTPRWAPGVYKLANGKVLIAGGYGMDGQAIASCELYDPTATTWSATGSMPQRTSIASYCLLGDGSPIIIGGSTDDTGLAGPVAAVQKYSVSGGTWSSLAPIPIATWWDFSSSAILLNNGKVMVTGGWQLTAKAIPTTLIYDPTGDSWTPSGDMNFARFDHQVWGLSNGTILVAGGTIDGAPPNNPIQSEVWDPNTGIWTVSANLNTGRYEAGTSLNNFAGTTPVIIGGALSATTLSSAELYSSGGSMGIALVAHTQEVTPGSATGITSPIDTTGSTLLVVTLDNANGTTPTLTDTNSNTWTLIRTDSDTNGNHCYYYYVSNPIVGSGHRFSVTGFYTAFQVTAWSGTLTSSDPLDQQNAGLHGTSSTFLTGSVTPTQDNELVIAFIGTGSGVSFTIDSGYTITDQAFPDTSASLTAQAYLIQTTAGATNPTWTASTSCATVTQIASFKAAPSGISNKQKASMNLIF